MSEDRHHEIHVSAPTRPVALNVTLWRRLWVFSASCLAPRRVRSWLLGRYDKRNESGQANDRSGSCAQPCTNLADRLTERHERERPLYDRLAGDIATAAQIIRNGTGDDLAAFASRNVAVRAKAAADESHRCSQGCTYDPNWCPKTRYYSIFTGSNLAVGDLTAEEAIEAMRDAGPDDGLMVVDGKGMCLLVLVDARHACQDS